MKTKVILALVVFFLTTLMVVGHERHERHGKGKSCKQECRFDKKGGHQNFERNKDFEKHPENFYMNHRHGDRPEAFKMGDKPEFRMDRPQFNHQNFNHNNLEKGRHHEFMNKPMRDHKFDNKVKESALYPNLLPEVTVIGYRS
jgi:hypothetical protein